MKSLSLSVRTQDGHRSEDVNDGEAPQVPGLQENFLPPAFSFRSDGLAVALPALELLGGVPHSPSGFSTGSQLPGLWGISGIWSPSTSILLKKPRPGTGSDENLTAVGVALVACFSPQYPTSHRLTLPQWAGDCPGPAQGPGPVEEARVDAGQG